MTFCFDRKVSPNNASDNSTPPTNSTPTGWTTFYDQVDVMTLQGTCMYLNVTSLLWLTDGCTTDRSPSNSSSVTCTCEHLTMFTVFFSLTCEPPSKALFIFSWIGCCLSLIALSITLITFITMSQYRTTNKHQKKASVPRTTAITQVQPPIRVNTLSYCRDVPLLFAFSGHNISYVHGQIDAVRSVSSLDADEHSHRHSHPHQS